MADEPKVIIEMFPTWWWRWHFCAMWDDGVVLRSTKATWGYLRTRERANCIAQEARRG